MLLICCTKEKNNQSLQMDPYCCAITITLADNIGPVNYWPYSK